MKKILNNVLVVIILTSLSSCAASKNSTMVKFKERMTYEKLSDETAIFEEAFAALVIKNNFDQ